MSKKQHAASVCILIICFCLWSDFIPRSNPFGAGSGYCLLWFVVLYVIASYIRKYISVTAIKRNRSLLVYVCSCIGIFALNTLMAVLSKKLSFLTVYEMDSFFSRYNCCLVLAASVALFCAFLCIETKNERFNKCISSCSKLTLGVYLIHGGPYTSSLIWAAVFYVFHIKSDVFYPVAVFIASLALYVACLAVDYIRSKIFSLFENRIWFKNLMTKIDLSTKKIMETCISKYF